MKTLIIVSKCLKITKLNQSENLYQFHFKGVFSGQALKTIVLRGRKDFQLAKGEDYLMYVQMLSWDSGTLKGSILKAKPLSECFDKS